MHIQSTSGRVGRHAASALLLALLASTPAHALLRFNDGRDQIYVTAYVGAGYDSNVFGRATGDNADTIITGGVGMEYARKAGMIGVNGRLGWDFGSFASFNSEDFVNPHASLEFTKGTGRTTGAMQFNARRDSRADPTIGLRTDSWNYGVNLNYRYPVIERYSISGNIGWDRTDYMDDGVMFSDLDSYTIGTDLFYSWRSDRDLLAGYRVRFGDAQAGSKSTDHTVYVGVSGRIVGKLSGSARVGWNHRITSYPGAIDDDTHDGAYVSLASTWPASRKATFTVSATQDFSTTSTNFQTRSTTADINGQFSHTVKLSTHANLGGGRTEYISGYGRGAPGITPGFNGDARTDHFITAGVGASYSVNSHLTLSTGYTCYRNWSSLPGYDFTRHSIDLTLSTRW